MRRSLHAILTLALIAWLPFCCCQVRSAAGALSRAVTVSEPMGTEQDGTRTQDAADRAQACCSATELSEDPVSCCHPEPGKPATGDCCSTCKDRVLPAATTLPDPDRFGAESPAALAMAFPPSTGDLLATLAWTVSSEGSPGGAPPPAAPAGRQALVAHGVLVV